MQLLPDLIPTSPQIMVQLCDINLWQAARTISYPTTLRQATSPATYPERTPSTASCTASGAICWCMPGLATTLFQKPAALSSQTSDICDCRSSDSKIGVGTDCLRPTSFFEVLQMQSSQHGPCLPSNTTQGKNPPHLVCKLSSWHHTCLIQLQHQPPAPATLKSAILLPQQSPGLQCLGAQTGKGQQTAPPSLGSHTQEVTPKYLA